MTSAQVVETSVTNNSSFQNYPHPDDHTIRTKHLFLVSRKISLQNHVSQLLWKSRFTRTKLAISRFTRKKKGRSRVTKIPFTTLMNHSILEAGLIVYHTLHPLAPHHPCHPVLLVEALKHCLVFSFKQIALKSMLGFGFSTAILLLKTTVCCVYFEHFSYVDGNLLRIGFASRLFSGIKSACF